MAQQSKGRPGGVQKLNVDEFEVAATIADASAPLHAPAEDDDAAAEFAPRVAVTQPSGPIMVKLLEHEAARERASAFFSESPTRVARVDGALDASREFQDVMPTRAAQLATSSSPTPPRGIEVAQLAARLTPVPAARRTPRVPFAAAPTSQTPAQSSPAIAADPAPAAPVPANLEASGAGHGRQAIVQGLIWFALVSALTIGLVMAYRFVTAG